MDSGAKVSEPSLAQVAVPDRFGLLWEGSVQPRPSFSWTKSASLEGLRVMCETSEGILEGVMAAGSRPDARRHECCLRAGAPGIHCSSPSGLGPTGQRSTGIREFYPGPFEVPLQGAASFPGPGPAASGPAESLSPRARVVEVLGAAGTAAAEADAMLAFFGLEWRTCSEDVEQEPRSEFPGGAAVVASELAAGRRDLRDLRCVTVDPPHAKDLDDAVSVMPGPSPRDPSLGPGVDGTTTTHCSREGARSCSEGEDLQHWVSGKVVESNDTAGTECMSSVAPTECELFYDHLTSTTPCI